MEIVYYYSTSISQVQMRISTLIADRAFFSSRALRTGGGLPGLFHQGSIPPAERRGSEPAHHDCIALWRVRRQRARKPAPAIGRC